MAGELQLGGSTVATHTGSGASAVVTIDSGVAFPAGHIVQIQTAVNTSTLNIGGSTSNTTWVDTGLSVNITPKFNNSKIYLHHVGAHILNNSSSFGLSIWGWLRCWTVGTKGGCGVRLASGWTRVGQLVGLAV